MDLSFMQNDLVLAICWTLIHSLWQGLLLAVFTGTILIATRKSNAKKRYRLLTFLFFLFMAVVLITFVRELNIVKTNQAQTVSVIPVTGNQLQVTGNLSIDSTVSAGQSFTDQFKDYFNKHASLIVIIWFIIFVAKFIKLVANLVYIQRLKHYKTDEVTGEWKEKLQQLIASLGINKPIRLLESGIVQIPLVMGVLKPVILIPAGLLANLPADEIEAILLHELAHIQRRDYFVNLLQSFAETIFFFNPALLWLSSMIREERENCCDDIAISITNSKTKFINALIAFQEYNLSNAIYNVGFAGKKNQLLNRIKRIVHEKNKTLNTTEKSILTFGIAVFIMFSFVAAKKIPVTELKQAIVKSLSDKQPAEKDAADKTTAFVLLSKHIPAETVSSIILPASDHKMQMMMDTIPSNMQMMKDTLSSKKQIPLKLSYRSVYGPDSMDSTADMFPHMSIHSNEDEHGRVLAIEATKKDGHVYKLMKVNDVVTEFSIDNVEVPSANFAAHSAEISDIETAYDLRREKSVWQRLRVDSARRTNSFNKERAMANRQDENLKRQLAAIERDRILFDGKRNGNYRKDTLMMDGKLNSNFRKDTAMRKDRVLKDGLRDRVLSDGIEISESEYRRDTAMRALLKKEGRMKLDKIRTDSVYRRNSVEGTEVILRKQQAIRDRRAEDDINLRSSVEQVKNIIADLQKENIKIDEKTSWFGLDNKQFVVDGKAMSNELYEKFRAKYLRPNGMGYYYGPIKITGTGVFLDYNSTHGGK